MWIWHRSFNGKEISEYDHHHHIVPPARTSLTLSRYFSQSFIASGRSSGLHPLSSHCCCMYVLAGHPALARPYVGVHRSTSLMSSSLLLQQCPEYDTNWLKVSAHITDTFLDEPKITKFYSREKRPSGFMDKVLDCDIMVWEFELQSLYCIHFRWPSLLGLQNTQTESLQMCKTPPTSGPVGGGCRIH